MAEKEYNFTNLVQNVKTQVTTHFDQIIAQLTKRKLELLAALEALDQYYKENSKKLIDYLNKYDDVYTNTEQQFRLNSSIDRETLKDQKDLIERQKDKVKAKLDTLSDVKFVCKYKVDAFSLASGYLQLKGKITQALESKEIDIPLYLLENCEISVESVESNEIIERIDKRKESVDDYDDSRSYSIIDSTASLPCKLISSDRSANFQPSAIAIDPNTSYIYAVDCGISSRVVVFTSEGEYINEIFPKLPRLIRSARFYGICIARGRMYISDTKNGVIIANSLQDGECLSYSLKGSIFNDLNNLDVDKGDGEVFVCDKGAMKIHIFDEFLHFKESFGERYLQGPTDVKIKNAKVIVLDNGDFTLRFFSKRGVLLGETITYHSGNNTIFFGRLFFSGKKRVQFFDIDEEGNAYITECKSTIIRKFDMFGGHLHQCRSEKSHSSDPNLETKGISIDNRGRLVCVSTKMGEQIQFFDLETLELCSP